MRLSNLSQHLQALKATGLVETRREGTRIYYRAADDRVCRFTSELAVVARARLAEVERLAREHLEADEAPEPLTRSELLERIDIGDVVVVDVRPVEEYAAGHIPGALSIPLEALRRRLRSLPKSKLIVAYCRGPFCVLAPQAVTLLRARGLRARRLEDGLPDWRAAGLPVAVGS